MTLCLIMKKNLIRFASDTVEAEAEFGDWPEQAQFDYQNRKLLSSKFEIFVTNFVAKRPGFIWWLTVLTCTVPISVFFAVDAPFLYNYGLAELPFTVVGLCLWACTLFLWTSFMDPGTMKPYSNEKILALEEDLRSQQPEEYSKMAFVVQSGASRPQFVMKRQHTWTVAGQEILTDWCYHCKIFKAPRVHHCKLCGRCIERFDHHCPWLDNCVGIKNYPWFLLLLLSYSLLWILVAASSVVHIILRGLFLPKENLFYIFTTILEVGAAAANLHFLNILLVCQSDLLKLGLTVHEFKTDKYFNRTLHKFQSPFDRGSFWANLVEACFSPWRPLEIIPKNSIAPIPKSDTKSTEKKSQKLVAPDTLSQQMFDPISTVPRSLQVHSVTDEERSGEKSVAKEICKANSNHLIIEVIPIEPTIV